jgi:16S rRNA (uracil1498-N3)-methyltransferase
VHRFFAPSLDPGDEIVTLPKSEAEHLMRVLRLGAGDTVHVFDGRGHEFVGRVVSAARRDVRVQLVSPAEAAAESAIAITLAQAVLKGDTMDDVIRDAAMLGAVAVQPLVTKRAETTVAALRRGTRLERWRRIALAATKQSRRAVLPDVRSPLTLEDFLGEPPPDLRVMLVEPEAGASIEPFAVLKTVRPPSDVSLIVGPEGGWVADEWRMAEERGTRLMGLGGRTLRADAVPVAAISILQFLWDAPTEPRAASSEAV